MVVMAMALAKPPMAYASQSKMGESACVPSSAAAAADVSSSAVVSMTTRRWRTSRMTWYFFL